MLEQRKPDFLFFLPQRHYTAFLFSGCLIRKHYYSFFYYFTKIYEIVCLWMWIFYEWTLKKQNILSVLERFKLGNLYLYSLHKTSKFLFNEERHKFHSEFLDQLSSFSVWYKSQSNDSNDSKKEDSSHLFCVYLNILRQPELTNCIIPVIFKIQLALTF